MVPGWRIPGQGCPEPLIFPGEGAEGALRLGAGQLCSKLRRYMGNAHTFLQL